MKKKSKLLISIIAIVYLLAFLYFGFWKNAIKGGDTFGYYIHLPSTFLYHDAGDYTKSIEQWRLYNPTSRNPLEELPVTSIGKRPMRFPVGVAVMGAPFFAIAHVYCWVSGTAADGFSTPYLFFSGLSTVFYALWGIWLLMLALKPYFKTENTRVIVGLTIALATNFFYSSTYSVGMSHSYLVFLYALLLIGVFRFYEKPSSKGAIWIGAAAGFITLVRSPEIICVLIPFLWGITKWTDIPKRIRLFREHIGKIGLAILAFVISLLPQAFYWKQVSGQWWYDGYQGEHLDFAHPHILDGIFNYSNGWLIYTPVMAFALLGIFWLRKYAAEALCTIMVFLPLHWYIIYSWWAWNYFNGFGSRPMIETLPLLAFPFAAFVEVMFKQKWTQILGGILLAFFIWLNLFQTWQVSEGLLLTSNTNRTFYWSIFGKTKSDDATVIAYHTNELQPDSIKSGWKKLFSGGLDTLSLVNVLATNNMEDSTEVLFSRDPKHSGSFSFRCDAEFSPGCYIETDTIDIRPGDYLKISVFSFVRGNEMTYEQDKMAPLIVHVFSQDGKTVTSSQLAASSRIKNLEASIWHTGVPELWGEASYFVKLPKTFKPTDRIKAYMWNPYQQRIFVDDMKVELWRYQ